MAFDTHAHYYDDKFSPDREECLAALPAMGIGLVLVPGCTLQSSLDSVALAERYPHVYAAAGWHPEDLDTFSDEALRQTLALCSHPKCVAVGEIGLDYYWDKEHRAQQLALLDTQLAFALKNNIPVIFHDRDAHEDSLNAVSAFPGLRGVFHCFSGSAEMAKILLKDGWYLGFDGPVTYKNNRRAAEVLAVTPLDRILLETDSPYLPPVPFRGQRNDSSYLPYIAAKVAELKGVSTEEMLALAEENGRRLFGIV